MGDPAVVKVFDTTLRDGEQSPGATMTIVEKLQVADQLVQLNVDVIEAGFPAASPGDLAAVKEIAKRVHGVAVAGLARANTSDIDAAWEGVREAELPVIHVFLATSDIHLQYKLHLSREEALQRVQTMVAYARNLCPTISFRLRMRHAAIGTIYVRFLKLPSRLEQPRSMYRIRLVICSLMNMKRSSATCMSMFQAWKM